MKVCESSTRGQETEGKPQNDPLENQKEFLPVSSVKVGLCCIGTCVSKSGGRFIHSPVVKTRSG
jgi:hypothetical protein